LVKENFTVPVLQFSKQDFYSLCDAVAERDPDLNSILQIHGYPPMWTRSNSFATLIHIILEQQVSLASAKAALNKLKQRLARITPERLLALSDEELRACYFSRQKIVYARHLAEMILSGKINLKKNKHSSDDEIRLQLKQVRGIGDWTTDVYLLFVLQRHDIFPVGDLALVNAFKEVKKLNNATREDILKKAQEWRPYRSIATFLLWHYYIQTRNIRL
jgi:DNA-3-methyladenine glycosylase II